MQHRQIKVSSKTSVPQLSGSILKSIEAGFEVEVRAVGASAVNQMYKGISVARGHLAQRGKDLYIKPGFSNSDDTESTTVMIANLIVK